MDVFSFILGILLTVGTMYIIRCAKTNKKVHRHILGKTGTTFYNGQSWAPPYPMSPTMSYPDPPPTAPYPAPTKAPVAIPWPIQ